jgi:hypothetical protein
VVPQTAKKTLSRVLDGLVLQQLVTTNQYSETNVMHFLFNLLRIKGLYMFRALLAHPQEELHKPHLVYYARVMSVGSTSILVQSTDITRT